MHYLLEPNLIDRFFALARTGKQHSESGSIVIMHERASGAELARGGLLCLPGLMI